MPAFSPPTCPECATATDRLGEGPPWCPNCEWNLIVYDPIDLPPRGWHWIEKRGHRLAGRLDRALFAELSHDQPRRPGWTVGYLTLVIVSALLLGAILATFGLGCWLIVFHGGPGWVALGVLLVALAIFLRPRLYRAPRRKDRLPPEQAPTLVALVERLSARIGIAPPDYLVLDDSFNASVRQSGFRRRTTLQLGMSLWLSVPPQDRVALLAHELAHTVNGDPNRSLLVQPAMATFARLADWTGARRTLAFVLDPDRPPRDLARLLAELAMWAISRVFLLVHLTLAALALRNHQRAEYLADHLAAQIAGTAATVDLLDRMTLANATLKTLYYAAERHPPAQWRELVDHQVQARAARRHLRRQLSRRRTSLWDSHPPDGLRAAILEQRTHFEPGLLITDSAAEQIDREFAGHYRRLHRKLLGTRDFRPDSSEARRHDSSDGYPAPAV